MFGCCGCPSKKHNRSRSDDAECKDVNKEPEEEKGVEETVPTAPQKTCSAKETQTVENTPTNSAKETQTHSESLPKHTQTSSCDQFRTDENFQNEEIIETEDISSLNAPSRKSSLKKPKPRLSISVDVQIIPDPPDDEEDAAPSPLSDEVFSGEALDPPRANLGVGPGVRPGTPEPMEFPRSPILDFLEAPRGKAPTPHPKRASMPAVLPRWLSEDEDDDDEGGGLMEPPVTPVAKDELALRRHRFFADLLAAAQAATEHRVRFDPLGPEVSKEADPAAKELEALLERLEVITARLEKAVPAFEEVLEPLKQSIVVTKSLEDLLDEHLTPVEKDAINGLISDKLISPDSSADLADLSDRDPVPDLIHDSESLENIDCCLPLPEVPQLDTGNFTETVNLEETLDQSVNLSSLGESPSRVLSLTNSDTDDNSSDSPDTVVSDSPKNSVKLSSQPREMTNSQSTLNMSVQGFQSIVLGPFATYLDLSFQIGGDVAEHAKLVQNAFQAQMQYLNKAAQMKKPSAAEEARLLQPTSESISAIQAYRESHRASPFFNHLSAISESIPALGWVTVSPTPSPFVKEMNDAGQFYTNRVLKDWKEKDKKHVEWSKAWVSTLTELQSFVKQHHTTGLVWSGTGSVGVPPPPPGPMPPPPPPLDLNMGELDLSANDRSALFAEINKGEDVTKGLKKVTSDMQTHKNPAMRSGPAPFKAPVVTPPASNNRVQPAAIEKPPKFARDGKKWLIEYQKGNRDLLVDGAEMNNVVYVFRCTDSVITVKGKVNSIFLDSCKKTAVVFDSVVASVEFVNCQSVQMQVLGTVPTISIDKTDGCQMYLSDKSLAVEIVSSKSSEMNVLVPKANGDFTEYPIPEQFRTTIGKNGLNTSAVESTG